MVKGVSVSKEGLDVQENYLKKELYDKFKMDSDIFEFLQESSLDGMWYWDLENPENEWMSPKFWETLGYNSSDFKHLSKEWQDIINKEDLEVAIENFYRHCSDPNSPYDQVVRYKHKNGSTVWIRCRGMAVRDQQGKAIRMLGAHVDLTPLKAIEFDLIKAKDEAVSANNAKSQFLSNMSHEIRTPMNGFLGMIQLMETTELTEEQRELMEIAKISANSLLALVNDILDYSKIEAGQFELNIKPFNLEVLIWETINLFKNAATAAGLSLEVCIEKNVLKHLKGDSFRLKQILSNIVINAIKFTKAGSVELHVKAIDKIAENKIKCEFKIKDTGIGIPLDQIEYLFKRFSQVKNPDTRQYGGSGLGLAICKGLVEMMDGEIWVESAEGEGSSFYFTCVLEAESENQLKSEQVDLKLSEGKRSVTILLAEDDAVSRIYIKKLAKLEGWDLTLAENGEEAVDIFRQKKFDLILMDAQMPIMNGYKATELIRSFEDTEGLRTPIIALTAFALGDDREKCLAAGMDDYLSKPISLEDLNAMIVKWTKLF